MRNIGIENIVSDFKSERNVFVTFDIDGMDYSIAAGTGSPMFGGFYYDEMNNMLECIAKQCNVID